MAPDEVRLGFTRGDVVIVTGHGEGRGGGWGIGKAAGR